MPLDAATVVDFGVVLGVVLGVVFGVVLGVVGAVVADFGVVFGVVLGVVGAVVGDFGVVLGVVAAVVAVVVLAVVVGEVTEVVDDLGLVTAVVEELAEADDDDDDEADDEGDDADDELWLDGEAMALEPAAEDEGASEEVPPAALAAFGDHATMRRISPMAVARAATRRDAALGIGAIVRSTPRRMTGRPNDQGELGFYFTKTLRRTGLNFQYIGPTC